MKTYSEAVDDTVLRITTLSTVHVSAKTQRIMIRMAAETLAAIYDLPSIDLTINNIEEGLVALEVTDNDLELVSSVRHAHITLGWSIERISARMASISTPNIDTSEARIEAIIKSF